MARTKQTARKWYPSGQQQQDTGSGANPSTLWPNPEKPAPMAPEQQEQITREDFYRNLFVNNRNSSEIADPHVSLINVFDNTHKFIYQDETEDEKAVPKILTKDRVVGRKSPCIVPKKDFLSHWQTFTNGILDGLNWDNVFAAGGSVLANITNPHNPEHYASSDIDLFLYGLESDEAANRKLEHIHSVVCKNTKQTSQIVRSYRAVTILGNYPEYRHVQVVLRLLKSPAEVLLGFDVDCCAVGYDGTNVWGSERFLRALSKGYNLVNMTRRSLSYETRLRKYSKRGYAVAVPNLDKSQVDPNLFKKSANDVQGLAKLLIYEYYELNPPSFYPTKSYSTHKIIPRRFLQYEIRSHNMNSDNIDIVRDITGEEDSDYAEFIPWGPSWYSHTILRMLEYKDKAQMFSPSFAKKNNAGGQANKQNKGGPPAPAPHRHKYITGIDGVINGSSSKYWCRYCNEKQPLQNDDKGHDVCGPLEWIKENAVMQDLDLGFKRTFGGSFQPILEDNWTKDVYSSAYRSRDEPHPLLPSPSKAVAPSSPLTSMPNPDELYVSEGGLRFGSQNQMLRQQRDLFATKSSQPSPFGNSVEAFGGAPHVDIFSGSVTAFGGGTLPFVVAATTDTPSKTPIISNLNSPPFKSLQTRTPAPSQRVLPEPSSPVHYATPPSSAAAPVFENNNSTKAAQPTRLAVAPKWWYLFGGAGNAASQMNLTSQGLLLVGGLYRKGAITVHIKSELKDLILRNDPIITSVLEAFFIDEDLSEVVDSLTRALSVKGIATHM